MDTQLIKIGVYLLIYLGSLYGTWKSIRSLYGKGGLFESQLPEFSDVVLTVAPVFNTIVCIGFLITGTKKESKNKNKYSKFFKLNR